MAVKLVNLKTKIILKQASPISIEKQQALRIKKLNR